ncbi:hypothetical protein F0562_034344 [Nyssa sinensis]|uniref:Disease resistance N-terminal domain-containing protein n=1 Tax=Nyssa sinensis TaxID=561372 RepID=A0A5J5AHV6_9ASTE|nr:hypothetical protein F0562_034344 [Nyssa sinensis]
MADATIQFLLENLNQLLRYNVNLIHEVRDEVGALCDGLTMLKAFLKDTIKKHSEFEFVKQLVRCIRDVTYDTEDVIDTSCFKLLSRRAKVKEIYDNKWYNIEALQFGESSSRGLRERRAPMAKEVNVVGFDKDTKMLVDRLTGEQEEREVTLIIGMGSLDFESVGTENSESNPTQGLEPQNNVKRHVVLSEDPRRSQRLQGNYGEEKPRRDRNKRGGAGRVRTGRNERKRERGREKREEEKVGAEEGSSDCRTVNPQPEPDLCFVIVQRLALISQPQTEA